MTWLLRSVNKFYIEVVVEPFTRQIVSFRSNVHPCSPVIPDEDFFFMGDIIEVSALLLISKTLKAFRIATFSRTGGWI